jgi:cytochrome c-type biogenesis protein CcmH/NrfG
VVLLVLTPILAFYLYVTLAIAWALLRDGRVASRGIAAGLMILVAVSIGLVVAELRFGWQVQALSAAYDDEPAAATTQSGPLPLAAGGRPDRDAADAAFERVRSRVEEQPTDWRAWYELGLAYGDARDSTRGRRAMRRAIELRIGDR